MYHNTQEHRDGCVVSCARYLAQLTSFALTGDYDRNRVCWPLLFTGARQFPRAVTTPIHTTLTTFETSEELSDSLCRLLQRYAPAVTRLRARKLALGDDHSDKQWGVRFLYLTDQWRADLDMYRLDYWDGGSEDEDASEQLVCLPKYPDGLTYIRTDANFTIGSTEVRAYAAQV